MPRLHNGQVHYKCRHMTLGINVLNNIILYILKCEHMIMLNIVFLLHTKTKNYQHGIYENVTWHVKMSHITFLEYQDD